MRRNQVRLTGAGFLRASFPYLLLALLCVGCAKETLDRPGVPKMWKRGWLEG